VRISAPVDEQCSLTGADRKIGTMNYESPYDWTGTKVRRHRRLQIAAWVLIAIAILGAVLAAGMLL
jgi:hypothetical protein